MIKPFFNIKQGEILADRYLTIVLSDWLNTLLLLAQAALIGWLITLRWEGAPLTPSLYYIMIVSAIWFGCINSCREIVKEKPIFYRERLFDLSIGAYLYSKYKILASLALLQCLILLVVIAQKLTLPGSSLMIFFSLWFSSLAGLSLGLLISAVVKTSDQGVALAPLVTIPQLIFSEVVLPPQTLQGLAEKIEPWMIMKWGYDALEQAIAQNPAYGSWALCLLALLGLTALFGAIAWAYLRFFDRGSP